MFIDREDAGRQLAEHLTQFQDENPIILAIPRGGVPVAYQVAERLSADFSLIIVRKLTFPFNHGASFGAISEDGDRILLRNAIWNISDKVMEIIIEEQKQEIKRRIKILRKQRSFPNIRSRVVILVDDGIAMGVRMRAAVKMCAKYHPQKIIVAAPVSSPELARALDKKDVIYKTLILNKPKYFRSIEQIYEHWHEVTDFEVLEIMDHWHSECAAN